jgi:hypothetical protein
MSGSTIGGVIGAGVGYYFGGQQGAQIGWMVGSAVGGYVDPDVIKGPKLTDAQALTVQEGAFRAIVYGTAVVGGNILQCGPLVQHKHRDRTGKGGPVQETYTYTRTIAIGLGEPVSGILRIWQDGKLVYDARDPAQWPDAASDINAMAASTGKFASTFTFYSGSETQLPDPSLEALDEEWGGGVGNVPAYRGTSLVVFPDLDVTQGGGAVSQFRFEVACCGSTTTTLHDVPWVTGNTGNVQSISSSAIFGMTAFVGGQNDNLRRSTDGGRTWDGVDYVTSTGWDPTHPIVGIWHEQEFANSAGNWYIATADQIGFSASNGFSFTNYITPLYDIVSVDVVNGTAWAGVASTSETAIFQPLLLADTKLVIGSSFYGQVTAIGEMNGAKLVGTAAGYILNEAGDVLYHDASSRAVNQFASDGEVLLIAFSGGDMGRSTDAGTTITAVTGATFGVVYARGVFYRTLRENVQVSHDQGITWTTVDSSFVGNAGDTRIITDGFSVLATTQFGDTAALPSAYVLPDVPNWSTDLLGNIVGATTIATDKCDANVADIVADLCNRCGIPSNRYDVSGITDTVRGFLIGKQGPASDNTRALQSGFFFDFPEWGDSADNMTKLRAIKRGGDSVVTITDDDLVQSDDDQDVRAQAVEFPRKINLITADVDADYNPTKQTAARETEDVKAVGESTMELAISATRTEAAPIVDKMLKIAWTEAEGTWERELPAEFTRYVPSDCFIHNDKRWRIVQAEQGDGTVKWTAKRDRKRDVTSAASPETPVNPSPPTTGLRGPTIFAAMNLPSLRSADNVPGMYVAVCGLLDGWVGCDLQLSVDGGLTYASIGTLVSECTMGDLTANADTSGTITARVLHGHTLESVTNAQIAARANAFAIVTSGVAEIGQFKTATDTANPGEYTLTDNTRGELGTTAAAHYTGDRFVLLDGTPTFVPLDVSLAGTTLYFRPVSLGTVAANNAAYPVLFQPQFTSVSAADFVQDEVGAVITAENGEYIQAG